MKTIELPLSANYVDSWGTAQAIRELLQNAIDSNAPLEFSTLGNSIAITSRDVTLPLKTLILGCSTKTNDDSQIGQFGEGYKLALLVLAREGLEVVVQNGKLDWTPSFRFSDTYGDTILHIDQEEQDRPDRDLTFKISGLDHSDMTDVFESCLQIQPLIEDAIQTSRGRILPSKAGKLYVNGLFVCDTGLDYGYDFLPQHITLERDRQTVNSWELGNEVKEMWFETKRFDEIAEMMEKNVPDLANAEYGCPESVKEACYRHFVSRNPGAVITSTHAETQKAVAKGMTVVQSSGGFYYGVSQSSSYKESSIASFRKAETPEEWLQAWAHQNQRGMSHPMRLSFKAVIKQAKNWKVSR